MTQTHSHLIHRVAKGDEQAFADFVRQYSGQAYGFVQRLIPETQVAAEIVNDVFLQVWLNRERLADIRNLDTYLYVVSRNHALNAIKKSLREKKHLSDFHRLQSTEDTGAAFHRALDLIDEALTHLSDQQRRCWILQRRMGKTYEQIEEELQISRNTVKTHLRLANASIKQYVLERFDLPLLVLLWFTKYFS